MHINCTIFLPIVFERKSSSGGKGYIFFLHTPSSQCFEKYSPLQGKDTCYLYQTPACHLVWINIFHCATGLHIKCTMPLFPTVWKKTVHCETRIRNICNIPIVPIVIEKTVQFVAGIRIIFIIPLLPIMFKRTVHCVAGIHIDCTIPLFPILFKKNRLLGKRVTFFGIIPFLSIV